jgi:hypothetical protein
MRSTVEAFRGLLQSQHPRRLGLISYEEIAHLAGAATARKHSAAGSATASRRVCPTEGDAVV